MSAVWWRKGSSFIVVPAAAAADYSSVLPACRPIGAILY
jgi:hypothetical protein